jgi:hypothetical protein
MSIEGLIGLALSILFLLIVLAIVPPDRSN